MHQLDHVMVSRRDLYRFTDAGSLRGQLIDSDHRAVGCKLRLAEGQRQKLKESARTSLARLDFSCLRGPSADHERRAFAHGVLRQLGFPSSSPPPLFSPPPASLASSALQAGLYRHHPSICQAALVSSHEDDMREDA